MTLTNVSFVLPMYNEASTIADTVGKLSAIAGRIAADYEIIIADDGSTDGSAEVVSRLARKDPRIKVVRLGKNTKFGGALKTGIKQAQKDVIIYTDSDLPLEAEEIMGAVESFEGADILTAYSRVRKGESLKRVVMSLTYNFLIQLLFRTNIRDINSGFKIYKKKVFENAEFISNSPFIDVEIFVKARKKGFSIKQYPVVFKHRKGGKSYISRPSVIWQTVVDMLRFRCRRNS